MNPQFEIDFTHRRENNKESEGILEANRPHLNRQCAKVLELLKSGERLTVRDAMINHGIGDLRRRCADLREAGYEIKSELNQGRFKTYFIEKENPPKKTGDIKLSVFKA